MLTYESEGVNSPQVYIMVLLCQFMLLDVGVILFSHSFSPVLPFIMFQSKHLLMYKESADFQKRWRSYLYTVTFTLFLH